MNGEMMYFTLGRPVLSLLRFLYAFVKTRVESMSLEAAVAALLAFACLAALPVGAAGSCGDVISLETHNRTTTRYALVRPQGGATGDPIALVVLAGGSGYLNL